MEGNQHWRADCGVFLSIGAFDMVADTLPATGGKMAAVVGKCHSRAPDRSGLICLLRWERPIGQVALVERNQFWRCHCVCLWRSPDRAIVIALQEIFWMAGGSLNNCVVISFDGARQFTGKLCFRHVGLDYKSPAINKSCFSYELRMEQHSLVKHRGCAGRDRFVASTAKSYRASR
jgi:hypothetical protein